MKRYFTLILMLCCCMLQGFAFDYTDENGVTWRCSESYGTAELTNASNYGAEVVVPEKVYDGDRAYTVGHLSGTFSGSSIITKVILPKSQIEIHSAFSHCANLTEVENSQYITSCSMGAFEYTNLTSIDLSNCKYVGGFDSSKKLKTVILKVCETIEQRAFVNCTSLQTLGETASITKIGSEAFESCSSLTTIDLPNCTSIESSAFKDCYSLNSVKFQAESISIGENAFSGINMIFINSLYIPKIDRSFDKNTIIYVPKIAINDYKTANGWQDYADLIFGKETGIILYEAKTTAKDNAPGLLEQLDKNNLNNIISLKVSGTINGYDIMLFRNKMDKLHYLDLSDADIVANPYEYYQGCCTQDSILGNNSFSGLGKIVSVKLPNSVKQIDRAFDGCSNLTSVELPESLKVLNHTFSANCI